MKKLVLGLVMLPMLAFGQTLDECQQAAEKNYPLIQQYGLIEKTTQLTVANIKISKREESGDNLSLSDRRQQL